MLGADQCPQQNGYDKIQHSDDHGRKKCNRYYDNIFQVNVRLIYPAIEIEYQREICHQMDDVAASAETQNNQSVDGSPHNKQTNFHSHRSQSFFFRVSLVCQRRSESWEKEKDSNRNSIQIPQLNTCLKKLKFNHIKFQTIITTRARTRLFNSGFKLFQAVYSCL